MSHPILDDSYRLADDTTCPSCGAKATGAVRVRDNEEPRRPEPGDFAICANCGSINHYDENLNMVKTQPPELIQLAINEPELFSILFKGSLYFAGIKAKENRYNLGRN